MEGKLIVIEGNNASGKGTQARLLVQRLRSQGKKVIGVSFPQYKSVTGKLIGSYLRGEFGDINEISPYLASTLYAFDRLAVRDKIVHWLKQGYLVVTDRYVESNKAFQAAKLKSNKERKKFFKYIDEIEYKIAKIPKPNLVVYLDVPLKIATKLHDKKKGRIYIGKERDIHERNNEYLQIVEKMYLVLAKENKWKKIKCIENNKLHSKSTIANKILREVHKM